MSPILVLLRKDFANFFRNRAAFSLTFVVPFALIYLFGQVFGVNRQDSGPTGIPLAVVNASGNPSAAKLVEALQHEKTFKVITTVTNADKTTRPLAEDDLRPMMRNNDFNFAVVLPADLVGGKELGLHLKIYSNPRNEIESQLVNGILQKTIFTNVPQLLGQSLQARAKDYIGSSKLEGFNRTLANSIAQNFGGNADDIFKNIEEGKMGFDQLEGKEAGSGSTENGAKGFLSKIVRIDNEQVAGKDVKSPVATRLVGGWAMQFLLFALSAGAASLLAERDAGIFHRVLAGPVSRAQILWSKFLYGVCIGLLQLMVLFFSGRLLFGIDVEHHLGLLLVVCAFAAAACTSFGMLIASLVSTMEAASGVATFVILIMCAIGGAWFPISMMPAFIQQLSKLTIVYWSMEGFSQVLWANASLGELLPTLAILGAITVAVMSVAIWRFNRGRLFE